MSEGRWFELTLPLRRLICRVFGHKMVSDDWATPDTGGMAGHCERCDFWYSTTLY